MCYKGKKKIKEVFSSVLCCGHIFFSNTSLLESDHIRVNVISSSEWLVFFLESSVTWVLISLVWCPDTKDLVFHNSRLRLHRASLPTLLPLSGIR